MTEILRVQLPIELTNGNDGRGSKWFNSARLRKSIEIDLRNLGHVREPFDFPVSVHLTRILGPRQKAWDMDSWQRGNLKELCDALTVCGWWVNDSPKWIKEWTFSQDASQRKNGPSICIVVSKAV